MVRRRNGRIFITTTTPKTTGHDFYHYKKVSLENKSYFTRNALTNDNVSKDELEKEVVAMGGWDCVTVRRELLNEDVIDQNLAICPEFKKDVHVVDLTKWNKPIYRDVYVSSDFGFVRDFTCVLFGTYDFARAKLVIESELVYDNVLLPESKDKMSDKIGRIGIEIRNRRKELWSTSANEIYPKQMVADCPSWVLSDLYLTNGVEFCAPTKYDKEQSIHELRDAFANNKIEIGENCHNLCMQLERGIWNKNKTDYVRMSGLGHMDAFDALIYMWRMIDRNANPVPRYVNAQEGNIHKYNIHRYIDNNQLNMLSDLNDL